jgi:enediyne biosynthesis protein E4
MRSLNIFLAIRKYVYWSFGLCCLFISCHRPDKIFMNLPSSKTNIDFENNLRDDQNLGILSYIYYYNGGGVAIGDVNNDGLPDIYFTANDRGKNKLYLNKGNFEFEDITDKAGVGGTSDWCTGVTMADVNGDGLLDIYVCAIANMHGLKGHNELFINNGNGTFTESSAAYGLDFSGFSTQAVFFDYDHDGDLDCFVLNQSEHPNQNIVDTSNRRKIDPNSGERLFRNDLKNGHRKFTDVSKQAGIYQSSLCYGLGIGVGDLNNDGWEDIYVGNDFHENDYYYINNGNGTFTESGADHFRHYSRYSMGNDIADFNNDGQLDVITADMLPGEEKTLKTYGNGEHLDVYTQKITNNGYQNQYSRNCLQRNNGNGISFSEIGLISGISATDWSWSPLLADFDNDGNKDLFISSGIVKRPLDLDFINFFSNIKDPRIFGSPQELQKALLDKMPDGASHPYLFKGDGKMAFKDMSQSWGTSDLKGYFNGAAYADLNNDGQLAIIINCLNAPAVILKNNTPKKNYISISCKGDSMNTFGIGTKAYVFVGQKMQYEQLMLSRGFQSSSEPRLHFGLDSISLVDSLLIVWPDQKYQLIKNVTVNKQLVVEQKNAKQIFKYGDYFPEKKRLMKDVSAEISIDWKHKENQFNDFKSQYLIPHMESTRGPKLAIADINGDGREDLFVCGAKGQAGCMFLQTKEGHFTKTNTAVFEKNAVGEGNDAVFIDVNHDGFPDLYVVSGGNEYANGDPALADHLYLNDGKGHFSESPPGSLPTILTNKSCAAVSDVNKDGSMDIFVGGLAETNKYGYSQDSYLLLNDGKGNFKKADTSMIQLSGIGMVTSCAFSDINQDGWPDLIVAGEWMPIKIFINERGIFKEKDIAHSSGLWQTVYVTDINGDGYPDLLAGNWGHNSKLSAGKKGPLKMYVKDFNANGNIEQVVTYTINGEEYPFLGKDQLELALPVLKRGHLTYDEVAGKSVDFLFGDLLKGSTELEAETLGSSCFINDGKGNFTETDLPNELQLAPIFAFERIPAKNESIYFASGNFYAVQPYEGRYDAMNPTIFDFDKKTGSFDFLEEMPSITGETRDAKWIDYGKNEKLLVVAKNNQALNFFNINSGEIKTTFYAK